jgi:tetratricopeptide (TPR) repeat protein
MADETTNPFEEGLKALASEDTVEALYFFDQAAAGGASPLASAYLAFCMARELGEFDKAVGLAQEAVRQDPHNARLYLILGRVHLLAGQKRAAIRVFQRGLESGNDAAIYDELGALGVRSAPPLRFLKRSNPINKYLGLLLKRVNLR